MTAPTQQNRPHPVSINLLQKSRMLVIVYDDGREFQLPCELLRVYSPSADVRGHGPGQEVLQTGKEAVNIREIEPVGNYAVKFHFDDGHNTGIYSWTYLYDMGIRCSQLWEDYLASLLKAGYERKTQ